MKSRETFFYKDSDSVELGEWKHGGQVIEIAFENGKVKSYRVEIETKNEE